MAFQALNEQSHNDVPWYEPDTCSEDYADWILVNRIHQTKKGLLLFTENHKFFLFNSATTRSIIGAVDNALAVAIRSNKSKIGFEVGLDDLDEILSWHIEWLDDGMLTAKTLSNESVEVEVTPKSSKLQPPLPKHSKGR